MSIYVDLDLFNPSADMKDKKYSHEKCTEEKELASAYIPIQKINKVYSPDESLAAGTVFPELYRPYVKKHMK